MQNKEQSVYSGLKELLILESLKNYNNTIVYDAVKFTSNSLEIVDFFIEIV